jgi:hypothetical protein
VVCWSNTVKPEKPTTPSRPTSAQIDDADSNGPEWEVVPHYQDVDEGDSTWTLKARDEAMLDKAESLIEEAIDQAASCVSCEKRLALGEG